MLVVLDNPNAYEENLNTHENPWWIMSPKYASNDTFKLYLDVSIVTTIATWVNLEQLQEKEHKKGLK